MREVCTYLAAKGAIWSLRILNFLAVVNTINIIREKIGIPIISNLGH